MSTTLSYVSNPRKAPYVYKTIIDALREDVTMNPDTECMIYRQMDGHRASLTYKELDSKATFLAKVLLGKGVVKGDRVALLGPNTLERAVAEIAIILCGGIAVHLTMNLNDCRDVLELFNIAECRFLLVDPGRDEANLESIYRLIDLFSSFENTKGIDDPSVLFLRSTKEIKPSLHLSETSEIDSGIELPKLYPEEDILVWTTSGSTGKPKMVPHSHFHLMNVSQPRNNTHGILYSDRPFGYLAGSPSVLISNHTPRLFTDISTANEDKSTINIWNIIKGEKCTGAVLLPYFLADLIQIKDDYTDPFKLNYVITGGQIVDKSYLQAVNVFTKALITVYSASESLRLAMHPIFTKEDEFLLGDVGTLVEGVEIKVVDRHEFVTQRGEPGEICIRSPTMFNGYYKNEDITKESFLEGHWFRTGDMGYIANDGRIFIQGRINDIISRGTRKIMPVSLEDIIIKMEGLTNVIVVPVPDKRLYEEVCVCFITDKDSGVNEESVEAFCEEKFSVQDSNDCLGQRPKYYIKFESFPKLSSGKFDRKQISVQAAARLTTDKDK